MKALSLIGIGGIYNIIIAKATSNNVKHTYDASCFVECIESDSN